MRTPLPKERTSALSSSDSSFSPSLSLLLLPLDCLSLLLLSPSRTCSFSILSLSLFSFRDFTVEFRFSLGAKHRLHSYIVVEFSIRSSAGVTSVEKN